MLTHCIKDEFNCSTCQCFCPKLDCDKKCGGRGLGVLGPQDEVGCSTYCLDCKTPRGKYLVGISPLFDEKERWFSATCHTNFPNFYQLEIINN